MPSRLGVLNRRPNEASSRTSQLLCNSCLIPVSEYNSFIGNELEVSSGKELGSNLRQLTISPRQFRAITKRKKKPAVAYTLVDGGWLRRKNMAANLLTEKQLAEHLECSVHCLRKWRMEGRGPRWRKLSALVRYDEDDVRAWVETQPSGGSSSPEKSRRSKTVGSPFLEVTDRRSPRERSN